jgi:hypothetical protein
MLLREAAHELVHAEQFAKAVARHGVELLPRIEDWQVHPADIFADTGIVGQNIPQSIQSEIGTQMASGFASALRVLRRSVYTAVCNLTRPRNQAGGEQMRNSIASLPQAQ